MRPYRMFRPRRAMTARRPAGAPGTRHSTVGAHGVRPSGGRDGAICGADWGDNDDLDGLLEELNEVLVA